MASILTNTSAMVALQNLRTINSNLVDTQSQIATGKKIANAKDNAAIWAVSKVLESDVAGFKAISDSLNLGLSTLSVGRNAAETISNLLTDLRGSIVAAQEENVDRSKIQDDVESTVSQIQSIVDSARFNGLTLVEGSDTVDILGSLQRSSNGTISAQDIKVARYDLTADSGTFGTGTTAALGAVGAITASGTSVASAGNFAESTLTVATTQAIGDTYTVDIDGQRFSYISESATYTAANVVDGLVQKVNAAEIEGITASNNSNEFRVSNANTFDEVDIDVSASGTGAALIINGSGADVSDADGQTGAALTSFRLVGTAERLDFNPSAVVADGDGVRLTVGGETFTYIASENENSQDIARGLQAALGSSNLDGLTAQVYVDENDGNVVLAIGTTGDGTFALAAPATSSDGVASGGLFGLNQIDVSTDAKANSALTTIDTLIENSIDAAASFGSSESRVEMQENFVSKLVDSLKTGIGALVDADLEAASARLQALQVQQQLGIQALSIANQAPQSILSLFR